MKIENRTLIEDDNLHVLRRIDSNSIDLIYLDPPFNSGKARKGMIGTDCEGTQFEDKWDISDITKLHQKEIENRNKILSHAISISEFTNGPSMKAYLIAMGIRLIEMHRILKSTGSIYYHCDPTASHYVKILFDSIFGPTNFRNEIIWHYLRWSTKIKRFQPMHDVILFYSKSNNYTFTYPLQPYNNQKWIENTIKKYVNGKVVRLKDEQGKYITRQDLGIPDLEGVFMHDVWHDIKMLPSTSPERVGYPTQKPLELIERIVKSSSNPGNIILDPFCGCGTTFIAAELHDRKWAGIDKSEKAIAVAQSRFKKFFGLFSVDKKIKTHRNKQ